MPANMHWQDLHTSLCIQVHTYMHLYTQLVCTKKTGSIIPPPLSLSGLNLHSVFLCFQLPFSPNSKQLLHAHGCVVSPYIGFSKVQQSSHTCRVVDVLTLPYTVYKMGNRLTEYVKIRLSSIKKFGLADVSKN